MTRVDAYKRRKFKHGRGGLFPAQHQQTLLDYARQHGIELKPEDFFFETAEGGQA